MSIEYLGKIAETKTITIERLVLHGKTTGYAILGTPLLTNIELNELIGVCHHQREVNVKQAKNNE